jgi:formylmethanofuran dehydrogenase subunit E
MVDPRAFLDDGLKLHGHKCPAMAMGLRAGAIAMNRLGVARSEGTALLAMVELGDDHASHCFGDGVQVVTGCTYGKGNIKQLGYGKLALTLVDTTTSRAVRVVPRADMQLRMRQQPFCVQYRLRAIPFTEIPDELVDPLIEVILSNPEAALFAVRDVFDYDAAVEAEDFGAFVCSRCNELVVEKYGRMIGDAHLCIPCQETLLAAGAAAWTGGPR